MPLELPYRSAAIEKPSKRCSAYTWPHTTTGSTPILTRPRRRISYMVYIFAMAYSKCNNKAMWSPYIRRIAISWINEFKVLTSWAVGAVQVSRALLDGAQSVGAGHLGIQVGFLTLASSFICTAL
jgi:hypothetical protein